MAELHFATFGRKKNGKSLCFGDKWVRAKSAEFWWTKAWISFFEIRSLSNEQIRNNANAAEKIQKMSVFYFSPKKEFPEGEFFLVFTL